MLSSSEKFLDTWNISKVHAGLFIIRQGKHVDMHCIFNCTIKKQRYPWNLQTSS